MWNGPSHCFVKFVKCRPNDTLQITATNKNQIDINNNTCSNIRRDKRKMSLTPEVTATANTPSTTTTTPTPTTTATASACSCKAVCVMVSETGNNSVIGTLTLVQVDLIKGPVRITGQLQGLLPGKHGISVCVAGNLSSGASTCGPIFNPFGTFVTIRIMPILLYYLKK